MKISEYIIIVLIIGMSFTAFGMILTDLETSYPDIEINKTVWEGKYNFTERINDSAFELKEKLDDIANPTGWTDFALTTITAMPTVVANVALILLFSMGRGSDIFSGILSSLGVPPIIIGVGTVIIIILVLFAAISFYHRSKA